MVDKLSGRIATAVTVICFILFATLFLGASGCSSREDKCGFDAWYSGLLIGFSFCPFTLAMVSFVQCLEVVSKNQKRKDKRKKTKKEKDSKEYTKMAEKDQEPNAENV